VSRERLVKEAGTARRGAHSVRVPPTLRMWQERMPQIARVRSPPRASAGERRHAKHDTHDAAAPAARQASNACSMRRLRQARRGSRSALQRGGAPPARQGPAAARACCMVRPLESSSRAWPQALVLVRLCHPWSGLGLALAISGSSFLRTDHCPSASWLAAPAPPAGAPARALSAAARPWQAQPGRAAHAAGSALPG